MSTNDNYLPGNERDQPDDDIDIDEDDISSSSSSSKLANQHASSTSSTAINSRFTSQNEHHADTCNAGSSSTYTNNTATSPDISEPDTYSQLPDKPDRSSDKPNSDPNSMVIAVSPSHAEYIESSYTKRKHSHEYYCLFCAAKFNCKLDAYPHFGEHLEYKPVLCLLCNHRFHDIDALTMHHQLNHTQASDLLYEIHEDQNIERWVDEFLESQNTPMSKRLFLKCSCGLCCPVCDRIRPKRNTAALQSAPCFNHIATDFNLIDHLHQHIAYHAYECSLCKKMGMTTRFTTLDGVTVNHLREIHSVRDTSASRLNRYCPKALTIVKLERFIAESAQKKRLLEKKWRTTRLDQVKSKKLMMQQFLQFSNSVPQNMQYPQTNGVSLNISHRNSTSSSCNNFRSTSSSKNHVAHVRVEGGRVVNLPSPLSIRAIQQRNNTINIVDLTQESPQASNHLEREGIADSRLYVKCLHCNMEFPNRKQLKIHHRQEHPGLSIACFTSPKTSETTRFITPLAYSI